MGIEIGHICSPGALIRNRRIEVSVKNDNVTRLKSRLNYFCNMLSAISYKKIKLSF